MPPIPGMPPMTGAPEMTPEAMPPTAPMRGEGMSPEEMKADLDNDLAKLDTKKKDLDALKTISSQNLQVAKRKILGSIFDLLKKSGVDPNNLESISKFIAQLEEQDPDLAVLFEDIFNSIGSMDNKELYPKAPEGPNLMDKFKNLGNGMMMPGAAPVPQDMGAAMPPDLGAPPMGEPAAPLPQDPNAIPLQ